MRAKKYQRFAICKNCGWETETKYQSASTEIFFHYDNHCPNCGEENYTFSWFEDSFKTEMRGWIPTPKPVIWWKPSTWGNRRLGKWVPKDELDMIEDNVKDDEEDAR